MEKKQIFFLNFICLYDYAFNIIYSLLDENRLDDIKNIYICQFRFLYLIYSFYSYEITNLRNAISNKDKRKTCNVAIFFNRFIF